MFKIIAIAALLGSAAQGQSLHERLLTLDSHLDTPVNLGRPGWSFGESHRYQDDLTQVDLPRMKAGGLDGGFFVIYTDQGPLTPEGYSRASAHAWRRAAWIKAMVRELPQDLELAYSPADAARIAGAGKRAVFQSIENSYPLGESVAGLRDFYAYGVRMAGPVHSGDNQFADSATGKRTHKGLSKLGREWVREANRLGILIDGSHASDETLDQMLELSSAPLVLSHSGPRALFDHARNLDDARIRRLAAKGGVIQVNSIFLATTDRRPERSALFDRREAMEGMSPLEQRRVSAQWIEMDRSAEFNPVTFDMFMKSLLHCLKLVGPDHVGIGADWDGGGGMTDLPDVALLPKITAGLKAAGYSDADIGKVWSGNLLRVLGQAQALAR
jgi:membrane dipeptidase